MMDSWTDGHCVSIYRRCVLTRFIGYVCRLKQLAWNTRYFRARLHKMGLVLSGHRDSPVVPVMIYMPGKLAAFSRLCLERGIGVGIIGFPATSLYSLRCRFCISAGHTKEMLDRVRSFKTLYELLNVFFFLPSQFPFLFLFPSYEQWLDLRVWFDFVAASGISLQQIRLLNS